MKPPSTPPRLPRPADDESHSDSDHKPSPSLAYLPSPSSSPLSRKSQLTRAGKKPKLEPAPDRKPKLHRGKPAAPTHAKSKARVAVDDDPVYVDEDESEYGEDAQGLEVGPLEDLGGLEQRRIAPSDVQGMEVRWDRQVKTINTTKAKRLYKLNDNYLYSLDRESTTGSMGYPMFLYSEFQVQQAAYDMQGGKAYFDAYVQRLHATKSLKAANKGLPTKRLDPKKPPLAPVAYAKKRTPKSWTDQTTRA